MNKIYQVIWSKTKHMYVVVSELAHHDGKAKTTVSREGTVFSKATAALVLAALLNAAPVYAADPTKVDIGNGGTIEYTEKGDLIAGSGNTVADDKSGNNVVAGTDNSAKHEDGDGKPQQFAADNPTLINETTDDSTGTTTITTVPVDGTKNKGTDSAIVTGHNATAQADGDTSVGKGANITNPEKPYYADKDGKATDDPRNADYFTNPDGKLIHASDLVYSNGQTDPDTGKPVETTDPYYKHTYETTVTIVHPDGTVEEKNLGTSTSIDQNPDAATKPSYTTTKDDNGNVITTKVKETEIPTRSLADGYAYYSKDMYEPSTDSLAAGTKASVTGKDGVAAGHDASAAGNSVAVGHKASSDVGGAAVGPGASAGVDAVAVKAGFNLTHLAG